MEQRKFTLTARLEQIQVFFEKPSSQEHKEISQGDTKEKAEERIGEFELFSLFTAEVIRKKEVFIR